MFDFAWTEIALIGVVALVAIGPKDMPGAIKAVADMVKKARRMAGEFQTHVDEMVREANLDEVRSQISQIRNLDIKGTIERAVDSDGSIRRTFSEDPLRSNFETTSTATAFAGDPDPPAAAAEGAAEAPIIGATTIDDSQMHQMTGDGGDQGTRTMERPAWLDSAQPAAELRAVPAFIPPAIASPPVPPAFIPPGTPPGGSRPSP